MLVMVSTSSSRSKPTVFMATVARSRYLVLTWYAIASPAVPIMGKSLEQSPMAMTWREWVLLVAQV